MDKDKPTPHTGNIGSVTVVGGGIAGIQTALDIANSGFKVHLVEAKPNVGGVMAQLDKTFPTNDCSSCMLGPKLAELANHPDIGILADTEVLAMAGEPGRFRLTLKKKPRYITTDTCTACGDCAEVCPVVRPGEHDTQLADRKAAYIPYAQAVPNSYAIEKYAAAPCRTSCPASINVQAYVAMVRDGKYREAVEIIMRDLPFPGILGRVCPRGCEDHCRRGELDASISIRELKRVAADHVKLSDIAVPAITPRDETVAVIGSGPAGLSAAYFLALDGYRVTVYESMPEAGGMLRYGIPEHRLPRDVLDAEIENLKRFAIKIRTNMTVGQDLTLEILKEQGFAAIFLAIGAWKSLKLRVPGEEFPGAVSGATAFLRKVHLGALKRLEGRIVVVGGGHSALDAARVALRLGAAEAHILYRRSRAEMPAEPEEISEAEKEGVKLHVQAVPVGIEHENGRVAGIRCLRTRLADPDRNGRPKPIPVEGSEYLIPADHVISAIGQAPDLELLSKNPNLEVSRRNLLSVNPETLQTNRPHIFAGGDVVTGPATVIEAVAAGKKAAGSIAAYVQGRQLPAQRKKTPSAGENWAGLPHDESVRARMTIPTLPPENRLAGFEAVNLPVDEQTAQQEAARCLDCGGCCECLLCVTACKAGAVTAETHAQQEEIVNLETGAVILAGGFEPFDVGLKAEYGHGRCPNVVTSLEYERILSAAGPFQGHIQRLSDGSRPRRIAWIQCVGSRDTHMGRQYCSSVCCMSATKQAMITKEHNPEIDTTIFYIDSWAQGKGFDRFYERSKSENDVRYVRSMISRVVPNPEDDTLNISYAEAEHHIREETYDLVVLSVGMRPHPSFVRLADRLGLQTRELKQQRTGWAQKAGKFRNHEQYFYFVGCLPFFDVTFRYLNLSPLNSARSMLKLLNQMGIEPVISNDERCCGHDALWCGDRTTFRRLAEWNLAAIQSSGARTVLFSCPEGYVTFKYHYPKYFGNLPFDVLHMTEFLARELPAAGLSFRKSPTATVTHHDPCRLGCLAGIYEPPRQLLQSLPATRVVEMERNRENALCCGTSAWMECSSYSKAIQTERIQEAVQTGVQTLITACPKCQIHFTCAQDGADTDIQVVDLYTYLSRRLSATDPTRDS